MPERVVKTTLIIDSKGAVRAVRGIGDESVRTEKKLGSLDKSVKGLGKSFGGLKSMIGYGAGALGLGGLAFGLKDVVSTTQEALGETEKFSAISGTSAQQSLYLTSALKARGISSEAAGKAFAFMATNIKTAERQEHAFAVAQTKAAAKGAVTTTLLGKQAMAFKQLGINIGALAGMTGEQKLKTVVRAFEDMSPAMKKAGDQAALMKEVFGRGGLSLATVLQGGATGLSHFEEVARKFFPQLPEGQKGVEKWMVANSEFHLGLEGLEFTLGMKLIPVLVTVEKWLTKLSLEVKSGKGVWGELRIAFESVWGVSKKVWEIFSGLVGKSNALKIAVGGLVGIMVVSKVAAFVGVLKGLNALSFLPLKANLLSALGPLAAAALAVESVHKSLNVHHPSKQKSHGVVSDVAGLLTGGLVGNPATSPINVGRALIEEASSGGPSRGNPALAGVRGSAGPLGPIHVHVHVDSQEVGKAVVQNPRARREFAESTAIYSQQLTARR